jgi:hypothetical protein
MIYQQAPAVERVYYALCFVNDGNVPSGTFSKLRIL